jgi:hypothetical protein
MMKLPANTPSPITSFQYASELKPKVLKIVAPGTSISRPYLFFELLVMLDI